MVTLSSLSVSCFSSVVRVLCVFLRVKGHADESIVRSGQVRALDRYGNSRADQAADFGLRRVWPDIADARRNLFWCM